MFFLKKKKSVVLLMFDEFAGANCSDLMWIRDLSHQGSSLFASWPTTHVCRDPLSISVCNSNRACKWQVRHVGLRLKAPNRPKPPSPKKSGTCRRAFAFASVPRKEAAAFGAFVGFTVFGTFQGTALTFFPSYRVRLGHRCAVPPRFGSAERVGAPLFGVEVKGYVLGS